jgi:anti-sigma regulatory factor (Ser/Thr protein kinase)
MQVIHAVPVDRSTPQTGESAASRSELEDLRVTCRRQASVTETLGRAVSTFHAAANALKAENADLRAEVAELNAHPRRGSIATPGWERARRTEIRHVLDVHAPAAARVVVTTVLRDRLSPAVLDKAVLIATELVTNSVRHSGASAEDALLLRLEVTATMLRISVEDPGSAGTIAIRPPDFQRGGGFGLNLVQKLSDHWGVERSTGGGTRVWAQLALRDLACVS